VELDFRPPGKPTDNAAVESFNGRLRQECLNAHSLLSLVDAQANIGAWRQDYNERRLHSALGWATPADFARRCCLQAQRRCQRSRKYLLQGGTESGTGSGKADIATAYHLKLARDDKPP
jgi:transposase InsO family protein